MKPTHQKTNIPKANPDGVLGSWDWGGIVHNTSVTHGGKHARLYCKSLGYGSLNPKPGRSISLGCHALVAA